jgi:hypothetical protein
LESRSGGRARLWEKVGLTNKHPDPPVNFLDDGARDARIAAQDDIAVVSVNVRFTAAPDY